MTDTHPKHFVRKAMKQSGLDPTEKLLDEINDVYSESRKENVLNLVYYRLINFFFSIIAIGLWFVISETRFEKPFFLFTTIAFGVLNITNVIFLRRKYKRLNAG